MKTRAELEKQIAELQAENRRLRSGFFTPAGAEVVSVPEPMLEIFREAEKVVAEHFSQARADPSKAVLEISDERYLLVRASSLSLDFLQAVQELYASQGSEEALAVGRSLLFDIAHTLGIKDARHFCNRRGLTDPQTRLSAGPVHFAYSGWAKVEVDPRSSPSPDQNFVLLYDHPYSFEADSWLLAGKQATCPVCVMSAGYSSGWCQESHGIELTAVEVLCRGRGDSRCSFVMAPPERVESRVREFYPDAATEERSELEVLTYFSRQQWEKTLRENEERNRLLVENAPEAIIVLDPGTRMFADFNERAEKLFGCQRVKLMETGFLDLSPEYQADGQLSSESLAGWLARAAAGDSVRFPWTHLHAGGREFPCEVCFQPFLWGGRPLIRGSITDRTDRAKAQEENLRLATALEQAAELIMITDTDGRILHVNPAFESVTGYAREEVLGQTPRLLKSGKHESEFYEDFWSTITSGRVWTGRTINRRKDGSLFEDEGTVSPVRDSAGRIVNYVCVKRDVSREADLERQLAQAHKMEAIGTLAGGIAHDLNNLLCPILGFAQMLVTEAHDEEEVLFNAAQILEAARKAGDLVSQIVDFSRKRPRSSRPIMLKPVLAEALSLLRRTLPSTVELEEELSAVRAVRADPVQIQQILLNLGSNAYHALKERQDPRIRVTLQELELSEELSSGTLALEAGQYALLSVCDNGHGMDRQTALRVFEPYFTTKELGAGTGLGLATVHGLVKSHGGHIEVRARPGQGADFRVYFPLCKEAVVPDLSPPEEESRPFGRERVLLVDDEPAIVTLVRLGLERLGYSVEGFCSAEEALESFLSGPESFDVLVTDQTMPGLTGLQLTTRVQQVRPGFPVVLMSGFSDLVNETSSKEFGIGCYVPKPTTPTRVARVVREAVGEI